MFAKKELEEERRRATDLKAQLEEIWKNESQALYELTSVFIHRGESPSWGHYFFYSRHLPDRPDEWFKYNDSDVSVVSKDDVLADTTGSTANPYLVRGWRRAPITHANGPFRSWCLPGRGPRLSTPSNASTLVPWRKPAQNMMILCNRFSCRIIFSVIAQRCVSYEVFTNWTLISSNYTIQRYGQRCSNSGSGGGDHPTWRYTRFLPGHPWEVWTLRQRTGRAYDCRMPVRRCCLRWQSHPST